MDAIARIFVALGAVGLAYLLLTDESKRTEKALNKVISTYNTGRMWSAFFGK